MIKLTDENLRTYNGHQWTPGEWFETSGEGELCGSGWIHYYNDATPALAVALDPIHANIKNPRLFRVEVSGTQKHEALKSGTTRLRLIEELPVPTISTEALVRWSILVVVRLIPNREKIPEWERWVDAWLAGQDRSSAAAWAAAEAARAARAAARAAEAEAAASAAAWAARAAAWAARAAAWAAAARAAAARAAEAAAEEEEEAPFAELLEQAIREELCLQASR